MIGIYKITNKNTGKSYIGQSNDIERRFKEHQIAGKKSRIPVDIAIQKYGKDLFTYEVVEECLIDQLNEREEYWIKFYDTFNNGYNCNPGGNQSSDRKMLRPLHSLHKEVPVHPVHFSDLQLPSPSPYHFRWNFPVLWKALHGT